MKTFPIFSEGETLDTTKTACPHGTMVTTYPDGEQRLWECTKCGEEEDARDREKERRAATSLAFSRAMIGYSSVPRRFEGKTLENFKADSADKKKIQIICQKYVERFDDVRKRGTSLVFCGKPGTGKTHLAYAIAMNLRAKMVTAVVQTASDMTAEIKDAYKREAGGDTPADVIRKYAGFDLLVIDEVGVQVSSEAEKRIFFDVINKRYEAMLPTIMISNLALAELSIFVGERVMDRMRENSGMVIAFDWESHR